MTDLLLGWSCLAIAVASAALWARAARRVAIPANRWPYVATWAVAAGLGVAALLGEPGLAGGIPAVVGSTLAALLLFTRAISHQKVGTGAVGVGDSIPHFTAPDEHGQLFDSRALAGHPTLIKFFRAHW